MDNWKMVWDWARKVWGPATALDEARFSWSKYASAADLSFNDFFRFIAGEMARAEGWEECGSSDVWHASFHTVKQLMDSGKVETRAQLMLGVMDGTGYGHGSPFHCLAKSGVL